MNLSQFIPWAVAQGSVAKYNDGQFLGECVSLINQYCYRVLGIPAGAWGNAKDWGAPRNAALTYFNTEGDLQPGDILVYPAVKGNDYGHIEIYAGNGQSLGQNRSWDRKVRLQPTLNGYVRILRSKTGGDEMPIPDQDNYYNRWRDLGWRIRGRELSRQEFRNAAVGKQWLTAIEILSDNPEAATAQGWQDMGKIAQRDNWQKQIYDLQAQVAALNKRPTEQQLTDLNKKLDELKKSADLAENKALAAEKKATEAIAENTKLSDQAESDKQVADTWLRRLGQFITKYLPGGK